MLLYIGCNVKSQSVCLGVVILKEIQCSPSSIQDCLTTEDTEGIEFFHCQVKSKGPRSVSIPPLAWGVSPLVFAEEIHPLIDLVVGDLRVNFLTKQCFRRTGPAQFLDKLR